VYLPKNVKIDTGDDARDNIIKKLVEILQTSLDPTNPYEVETKEKAVQVAIEIE
jgi:hypothetical protein